MLTGILILTALQTVFTPTHNSEGNPDFSIHGFEMLPRDSVDAVFLGSSIFLDGISPMKIYRDTGVKTYNLATSGQPVSLSCSILERVLRTQSPKVVFLDVGTLFGKDSVTTWRYFLDNISLDSNKIDMARKYQSLFSEQGRDAIEALVPMIAYHSRWNSLTKENFDLDRGNGTYFTMGFYLIGNAASATATIYDIDQIVSEIYENRDPERIPHPSEQNIAYLDKMQTICSENGAELILVKLPSIVFPQDAYGRTCWSRYTYEQIRELATSRGLTYIDLNYDVDTGVDFKTDSLDGGVHLNICGAEKVSAFLGSYLEENYTLDRSTNQTWDKNLELYDSLRQTALLQATLNFRAYLARLAENMEGRTIVIAAKEEYISGLDKEDFDLLKALGLTIIQNGGFADSYLAVIQDGIVQFEKTSKQRISYDDSPGGIQINAVSSGWYSTSLASIKINGTEYAMNSNGLNIVVWDNNAGLPMDSAAINTRNPGSSVGQSGKIFSFLRNYEKYLMQQDKRGGIAA